MRPIVFLFDIDGTLIYGKGAGRMALEDTFEALYGRRDALRAVVFHGHTDRGIARDALTAIGQPVTEAEIDRALARYVERLPRWIEAGGYQAHRGVVPILDALEGRPGVALGLGTGNIEPAARLKLTPPGLERYFDFGGFGSDAEDRAELLEVGARRGAARLGVARDACDVVVIGDTVRDVAAAHVIGARCVAVATGGTTLEVLQSSGAAHVFADLETPGAFEAIVPT